MCRVRLLNSLAAALVVCSSGTPARAQRTVEARFKPDSYRVDMRVDVPLVLVPVHVTTAVGASVTGLDREAFRLFEDNVEQEIASFAKEDAPVSVGLLVDISGSMREKIRNAAQAVIQMLNAANTDDEFFLVEFNSRPRLAVPFTNDVDDIRRELGRAHPYGRTALLDAMHLGLSQMKTARHYRKAFILVSDGGDNRSRITESELREAMLESDVQVYAIGIFDAGGPSRRTREEREGPELLNELAVETGGRFFPVENLGRLPEVCLQLGDSLRTQYLLGYAPRNKERDGKFRRVKVIVKPGPTEPKLYVRYRPGYRAPVE